MKMLRSNIINNLSLNFTAEIVNKIFAFAVSIVITRYLGPDEYGRLTLSITLASIVYLITDTGISTLITKNVSQDLVPEGKYFEFAFSFSVLKMVLGLFSIMVISFVYTLKDSDLQLFFITSSSMTIWSLSDYLSAILKGKKEFKPYAYSMFVRGGSMLLLSILFTSLNASLTVITLTYLIAAILSAFTIILFAQKNLADHFSYRFDLRFIKKTYLQSLPYALTLITSTIYLSADIIILSKHVTNFDLGIYSLAYGLIISGYIIPSTFSNTFFPYLAQTLVKSYPIGIRLFRKQMGISISIGVVLTSILLVLSDYVFLIIYGENFVSSSTIFKLLLPTLFLKFITFPTAIFLVSVNLQNKRVVIQVICALLNIILNILFIPIYGVLAAVFTTVASEMILCVGYSILTIKKLYKS